ncbi:DUF6286 domain-containing Asp23/Gls24 family envelope stress response protein [Streptomyces sp. NPDC098789]|uniref:DUF6286 domain-containing Asp23/Gls24 family envelope stress response protein n=1 Tax=Streptomyces sp. NPDC098789 TaxID=3366098 RepID=UPI0038132637
MTAPAARGTTTIADKAVRKIAERAAREALPAPPAVTPQGAATVHRRGATVALRLSLPYPAPLAHTARRVQQHVAERTRHMTGLDVAPPRLAVTRLSTPTDAPAPIAPRVPATAPKGARTGRRWWSPRRAPLTAVLLLGAAACAAVTVDVVRVRATHHPAAWRADAVEWLVTRHGAGDAKVTVGALTAVALGAWLLALALTPGRRRLLTLAPPGPRVALAMDRSTLAALVTDAVSALDGIDSVRVRSGRRRLTVRARLAFGDRGDALQRVTAATERTVARCGLRRPPRRRVAVVPEPTWERPPAPATVDAPDRQEDPSA